MRHVGEVSTSYAVKTGEEYGVEYTFINISFGEI